VTKRMKYQPAYDERRIAGYWVRIRTGPVSPPLGGMYHHYTSADMQKEAGDNSPLQVCPVRETYGTTQQEAIEKMKEQVRTWADEQQKKDV
jgi:hypothetical protein